MKQRLFLLLLAATAACSTPATDQPETAAPLQPAAKPAATEAAPAQTARRFVGWYIQNAEKLPADFVLNSDAQDSTKFYAVNVPGTEDWLRAVQQSGTVSEAYLSDWRAYFRRYDDTLRLHPQNDGPAAGFDYDFLMLSQEPEENAADLQKGQFVVTRQQGRHAQVQARGPKHETYIVSLDFDLTQQADGRWLIDKISVPDNPL
ncbi:hypothetical protein [Hymenobacter chitinivorans]|uniref:DUF3828 domain-containing protein n=1 Tax=Hymenobacter chitinivorans DSM 11115 TaxID=1121954 RepID=A0A2M9BPH4_9BACT|nr:hypothetical protein [Hymenobacter chitinivorans]PJJ59822.1 hypothetical protein CLV45_1244 [Hymenobacter chitinivorans DSM 11115]